MAVDRFDTEMKNIIENEVAVMEKIRDELSAHQNEFVQLYDVVYERDRVCIVMELLEGKELFDRIVERRKYTERDAKTVLTQILRATQAMHSIGLIHRDLKPENLVYAKDGDDSALKVMDFGLTLDLSQEDPHTSISYVGTLGYVAPECLMTQTYTPAADVWSIGVILYILLVGRQPFKGRNAAEQMAKTKAGNFSLKGSHWSDVSDKAKDLVRKMLDVDPHERITIDEALKHEWLFAANLTQASKHLAGAVSDMRIFNDRRRLRVVAEHVMKQASSDLRLALMGLLETTAEHTAGLSAREIQRVVKALSKMRSQGKISRAQFIKVMQRAGLGILPSSEMFDTLVRHSAHYQIEKETEERDLSLRADDTVFLDVDELIVGLSIVAAKESRERVLQSLFNFLRGDGEGKSMSSRGFRTILQVVASYQRPETASRRQALANDLGALFGESSTTNSKQLDVRKITFDDFKRGILEIADHLLYDYMRANNLIAPMQGWGIVQYVARLFNFSRGVWQSIETSKKPIDDDDEDTN